MKYTLFNNRVGVILLLALNVVLVIKLKRYGSQNIEQQKSISYCLSVNKDLLTAENIEYRSNNKVIDSINLINLFGEALSLNELTLKNDKMLIFRYSEMNCNVCVDSALFKLNHIFEFQKKQNSYSYNLF